MEGTALSGVGGSVGRWSVGGDRVFVFCTADLCFPGRMPAMCRSPRTEPLKGIWMMMMIVTVRSTSDTRVRLGRECNGNLERKGRERTSERTGKAAR